MGGGWLVYVNTLDGIDILKQEIGRRDFVKKVFFSWGRGLFRV